MTDGTATHGWSIGRTAQQTQPTRGNDGSAGAQADAATDAHVAEAGGVTFVCRACTSRPASYSRVEMVRGPWWRLWKSQIRMIEVLVPCFHHRCGRCKGRGVYEQKYRRNGKNFQRTAHCGVCKGKGAV